MKTYAIFDDSFFKQKPWWMPYKLYNVVCLRSNPRSREYMLNILQEKFPDAQIIDTTMSTENRQLVLLYPDAIGLGWSPLERALRRRFNNVKVLNGRKRCFQLDGKELIQLRVRRFLEITFLPEIIFAPFLLIYGTVLTIKDKIRGRL